MTPTSIRLSPAQVRAIDDARDAHQRTTGVRLTRTQALLAGGAMWVRSQGVQWPTDTEKEPTR